MEDGGRWRCFESDLVRFEYERERERGKECVRLEGVDVMIVAACGAEKRM
jgi:hypothetical protein